MRRRVPDVAQSFSSFGDGLHTAVIGATGGIGSALADALDAIPAVRTVARLSRSPEAASRPAVAHLDLEDEDSIATAAAALKERHQHLDLVVVATGILHADGMQPEKSWQQISARSMERAFRINTTGPALVAKHFLPLLATGRKAVFAALSARVGSIEDNRLGGWHAYRASKAALNMTIRTLSVELARRNPTAICVGLHPGTVDTPLSRPFQGSVPREQLFSAHAAAQHLLDVIDGVGIEESGKLLAWNGQLISF